uniref:VWFC domain-containing protein n=1 Tax=Photinus pyralis TaxID=7054 RepID=A0A1Y1K1U4_PHOPY
MRVWKEMKFLVLLGINSVILQILQCIVLAGPARRSSRMIREVYPEIETEKLQTNQPEECEHRGRFYANGERIETPAGGECKVCYCRGGELQCAEVSCYIRTDCEGRTVPGQCCPKYDHCPPREPILDHVPYTTPSNSEGSADPSSPNTSYEIQLTTSMTHLQEDFQTPPEIRLIDSSVETNIQDIPKITIQEIIPEIKEIPITGPPKREINLLTQSQVLDAQITNKLHKDDISDTETESSEISEIYHHPPPILKIGDQLLVLKKGELIPRKGSTPRPVITVIGAEGLQRGTEDSGETHEVVVQRNDDSRINYTDTPTPSDKVEAVSVTETNVEATTASYQVTTVDVSNFTNSDVNTTVEQTAGALERVKTLTHFEATTEIVDQQIYSNETTTADAQNTTAQADSSSVSVSTEISLQVPEASVPLNELSKHKHDDELIDQNPEYPPIPDIMTPQNIEEEHSDLEDGQDTNRSGHPLINTNASLPSFLLEETAPSDINPQDNSSRKDPTTETEGSKETVEDTSEESGELTTPPSSYPAPMLSVEDASIETVTANSSELVEIIRVTENTRMTPDVEIIDPQMLTNMTKENESDKIPDRSVKESETIFKKLNHQLSLNENRTADKDAEAIFKELLEEATSSMPPLLEGRETESDLFKKVSEAIAKYQKKETKESLDVSILGILKDFFNSQYKNEEKAN